MVVRNDRSTGSAVSVLLCLAIHLSSCSGGISLSNAVDNDGKSQSATFGAVREGEQLTHVFKVENASAVPISIAKTMTSCGCTVASLTQSEIPANGSTEMEVKLNTSGKSGKTSAIVTLVLADNSTREYILNGYVYNEYLHGTDFGEVLASSKSMGSVELWWPEVPDFVVESLDYDKGMLTAEFDNRPADRKTVVKVSLIPDTRYGVFSSTVKIRTNDPQLPEYSWPITGYVQYPVEVEDYTIAVGEVHRGKSTWVVARLHAPYGNSLEVDNVEYLKGLPGAWKLEALGGNEYELRFELIPPDDLSKLVAASRLKANAK